MIQEETAALSADALLFGGAVFALLKKHKVRRLLSKLLSVFIAVLFIPSLSVSAKEKTSSEKPKPVFYVTDCTDGKANGQICVKLQKYDKNTMYFVSFDSGKNFSPMKNAEKVMTNVHSGFYNICVKKSGEENTAALVYTVYVGSDEAKYSVKAHFVSSCESIFKNGKIRAVIDNYDEDKEYELVLNDGEQTIPFESEKTDIPSLTAGEYKVSVREVSSNKLRHSPTFTVKVGGSVRSNIYTAYMDGDRSDSAVRFTFISSCESIYKDGRIQAVIENYDDDKEYELVLNDGKKVVPFRKNKINLISLTAGEYKISVRETSSDKLRCSPTCTVKVGEASAPPPKKILAVEKLLQNPELPTGCEITSLTMLLNYIGFDADKLVLADKYLEKGEYRAADPNKVFVGDPASYYAYGCYSDVIVNAAEKFLEDNDRTGSWEVRNITGCDADALYSALAEGNPVVVWATMGMKEPKKGAEWIIPETNEKYVWAAGEHCLLLTGYDSKADIVYMNDPLKGAMKYKKSLFEKRFVQMGRNAVIITKDDT